MSEDVSDPKEEYLRTTKSIETLQRLAQLTSEAKRRRYLQDEIDRLTTYREELISTFQLDTGEIEMEASLASQESGDGDGSGAYPILHSFRERYRKYAEKLDIKDPELRDVYIYAKFFEDQYFPVLDRKKIDLDHMSGIELESFFNLFSQLKRRMEIFASDSEFLSDEKGGKTLKRLKAKQILLVEVYKFFKRVRDFCGQLLEDIAGPQKLCFNGDTQMRFTANETALVLYGSTVKSAVQQIAAFCREVIDFLDIPSFKQ